MTTRPAPDPPNREDLHKHLDLLQAVIARMSAASTTTKSWLLPVVTAAYGYAFAQHTPGVAWLGVGATALFLYLDVNYLHQEKGFRRIFRAVTQSRSVPRFSLNPKDVPRTAEDRSVWMSWSILPFYLPIIGVGLVLVFRLP